MAGRFRASHPWAGEKKECRAPHYAELRSLPLRVSRLFLALLDAVFMETAGYIIVGSICERISFWSSCYAKCS
jgi:hypothetical protein